MVNDKKNIQMQVYNGSGYDELCPVPAEHASSHGKKGTDPITPDLIGAQSKIPIISGIPNDANIWIDPNEDVDAYYTTNDVDTLLARKADTSSVYAKTETYSKSESDTLLANKAPAGYGLGGGATFIGSGSDLNDYKACGWYAFDTGVANTPSDYGSCIVLNKGGSYMVHQIVVTGFGQNICIRRYYSPTDEWDAWEWVNPPMQLGVEYRTTERYQGKPVYVSLINCGNMPSAGASKTVQAPYDGTDNPITNAWIVHSHLSYYNQTLPMYGYDNTVTVRAASGMNGSGLISIYASEDTDLTNSNAILYVVLKYTKSTD